MGDYSNDEDEPWSIDDEREWESSLAGQLDCEYDDAQLNIRIIESEDDDADAVHGDTVASYRARTLRQAEEFKGTASVKDMPITEENVNRLIAAMRRRGKRVPEVAEREAIIKSEHALGHFGERAILRAIEDKGFWWPYMLMNIREQLDSCNICKKNNVGQMGYHPQGSVLAERPGDLYQVDVMHMPESAEGHRYLLVLVDVFTRFVLLKAVKSINGAEVALALWEWFCVIGPPKVIQSDRGPEFINEVIEALCKHEGIHHRFTTAYNPRANSVVEGTNNTTSSVIVKMMEGEKRHWHLFVPLTQLVSNNKIKNLTRSSPFSLMFNRRMNELIDYTGTEIKPMTDANWKKHQEEVIALVFPAIEDRQLKMTKKRTRSSQRRDASCLSLICQMAWRCTFVTQSTLVHVRSNATWAHTPSCVVYTTDPI